MAKKQKQRKNKIKQSRKGVYTARDFVENLNTFIGTGSDSIFPVKPDKIFKINKIKKKVALRLINGRTHVVEPYTFDSFMLFEVDDSGKRKRLNITEDQFRENNGINVLDSTKVLIIVKEDLRRIYIWNGITSPVRKKFIASRVATELQQELIFYAKFHRCKIVSVNQGDEPQEFLDAFELDFDEYLPYPYIFKPPTPPKDLGLVGQLQAKKDITEEEPEYDPYCKHCGAKLPEGQTICHVCGKKVL